MVRVIGYHTRKLGHEFFGKAPRDEGVIGIGVDAERAGANLRWRRHSSLQVIRFGRPVNIRLQCVTTGPSTISIFGVAAAAAVIKPERKSGPVLVVVSVPEIATAS
jgi:hypothetical protein